MYFIFISCIFFLKKKNFIKKIYLIFKKKKKKKKKKDSLHIAKNTIKAYDLMIVFLILKSKEIFKYHKAHHELCFQPLHSKNKKI